MIRLLLTIGLVVSILTLVSSLIADPITSQIDGALVYFLSYIHSLDNLVDASALLTALQMFFNFMASVMVFWVINFVYSMIGGRQTA